MRLLCLLSVLLGFATSLVQATPGTDCPRIDSQTALNARFQPDIIFAFDRSTASACNAELGGLPVRVVHLSGDNFFHPGPRLVDGLAELGAKLKP